MTLIDIASPLAPFMRDELRWLSAYRRMAPHAKAFLLAGAENVAKEMPRAPEAHLRLVTGNQAAGARTEPR